jgi:hypothetical protein
MEKPEMIGFSSAEEEMIRTGLQTLQKASYDTNPLQVLIRADMPNGYRGMTLADGAALSEEAFSSQAMLNHVLEEELLHHQQKIGGEAQEFQPGTAQILESDVHARRKFPIPES